MGKINVAELLKNCQQGMELDCTMYNGLEFDSIDESISHRPIKCRIKCQDGGYNIHRFSKHGLYDDTQHSKCVIFPKGKTSWEGFVPPCKFKDGDVVYIKTKGHNHNEYIIIFKEIKNDHIHKYVCFAYQHLSIDKCALCHLVDAEIMRLATEEEKQKLFDAIKANGYRWDAETKTLEKLVEPKFKVGDRIRNKKTLDIFRITNIDEDSYYCGLNTFWICDQDNFELVPNKFDITTLKPFDKVLVRDSDTFMWSVSLFSHIWNKKFFCVGAWYNQCIPYEGNEHLLGTTDDCNEYYKTWE